MALVYVETFRDVLWMEKYLLVCIVKKGLAIVFPMNGREGGTAHMLSIEELAKTDLLLLDGR